MCIAVPGRVVEVGEGSASSLPGLVRIGTRHIRVNLVMVPEVRAGDFVLVHSGYATAIVSEAHARSVERLARGIAPA